MQSENTQYKFTSQDLPELYAAANAASLKAQKNHLMIIKGYLILLIIGSLLTVYSGIIVHAPELAIFVFLCTLSITVLQVFKRYDKIWYNGRAVAESIKTRSWRYAMRTEPFNNCSNEEVVRASFRSELKEILKENKDLASHLEFVDELSDTVTEKMTAIRSLSLNERIDIYKQNRIDDQRKWYAVKAGTNKRFNNLWFVILVVIHIIIIICLIFKITHPRLSLPDDTLVVIAGGIVTWTQVKKYQDLSTSYLLTAREIGIIKGDIEMVKNEDQFSDFVKDAENAFSREHTQWVARKDS